LYRKKLFKVIFYEIFYRYKYSKSNHFYRELNQVPAAYYFIYKISKFVKEKKIMSIVDLGCGSGRLTNFLSDKTEAKIYGYEIDDETYEVAKPNKNHDVEIFKKDIKDIDFKFLEVECFIVNDPMGLSDQIDGFKRLINNIHDSKKNKSKKYYIIGINLDADERHKTVDKNYVFPDKDLLKVVSAGPNKKIKFFEYNSNDL